MILQFPAACVATYYKSDIYLNIDNIDIINISRFFSRFHLNNEPDFQVNLHAHSLTFLFAVCHCCYLQQDFFRFQRAL